MTNKDKQVRLHLAVVVLYGEVAALINHRQMPLAISTIINKFALIIILARKVVQVLLIVLQEAYEVSRRTSAEPINSCRFLWAFEASRNRISSTHQISWL